MPQPTDVIIRNVDQLATKTRGSPNGRTPDAVDFSVELDDVSVYILLQKFVKKMGSWAQLLGIGGESARDGREDNL